MINNKVEETFKDVKTISTLSPVVQKIFASINDPNVGAKALSDIIMSDQTLTARVLKLVNSSFFGLRGKIQNIHHAVTMLGFSTIRQICLGVSICGKFNALKGNDTISGESFWIHSIATAILSKILCKAIKKSEADACFTIGLIHDIGKLILIEHDTDRFREALSMAKDKSMPLHEAEKEVSDLDHTDVGDWLLRKWNLPRESRQAVKHHHSANIQLVSPASPEAITGIVYFANQVAHHLSLGASGNPQGGLEADKFEAFFGKSYEETNIDRVYLEEEVRVTIEILGISEQNLTSV
jgi:putative nucleotidyltransferase with HDIG domain